MLTNGAGVNIKFLQILDCHIRQHFGFCSKNIPQYLMTLRSKKSQKGKYEVPEESNFPDKKSAVLFCPCDSPCDNPETVTQYVTKNVHGFCLDEAKYFDYRISKSGESAEELSSY